MFKLFKNAFAKKEETEDRLNVHKRYTKAEIDKFIEEYGDGLEEHVQQLIDNA